VSTRPRARLFTVIAAGWPVDGPPEGSLGLLAQRKSQQAHRRPHTRPYRAPVCAKTSSGLPGWERLSRAALKTDGAHKIRLLLFAFCARLTPPVPHRAVHIVPREKRRARESPQPAPTATGGQGLRAGRSPPRGGRGRRGWGRPQPARPAPGHPRRPARRRRQGLARARHRARHRQLRAHVPARPADR